MADYMPVAHAASFDAAGQKLYMTLSLTAHSYAIGVVDAARGQLAGTIVEDDRTGQSLVGLSWCGFVQQD